MRRLVNQSPYNVPFFCSFLLFLLFLSFLEKQFAVTIKYGSSDLRMIIEYFSIVIFPSFSGSEELDKPVGLISALNRSTGMTAPLVTCITTVSAITLSEDFSLGDVVENVKELGSWINSWLPKNIVVRTMFYGASKLM